MRLTYNAKRALAFGHTITTAYTLDMWAQEPIRTYTPKRKRHVAIDGTEENLLLRIESEWAVVTDHFTRAGTPSGADLFAEFIASVMGGESFTFDPYRQPGGGADVLPLAVTLVDGSYTRSPVDPSSGRFTASFSVREKNAIV